MANYKEIYSDKPFIEELHRMDSLGDDGYEVWVYEGDPDYAPLSADYTYELLRNTNIVDGSEITIVNGISMPIEGLKIFGEARYDRRELPGEYILLSYLGFNGTQYINTGINGGNINLKIETTFDGEEWDKVIFGARQGTSSGISYWTHGYVQFGGSSNPVSGASGMGEHFISLSKNGLYIDGSKTSFIPGSNMVSTDLLIGKVPGDSRFYVGKIYDFKVYDNGTCIGDFIPAKRKSDNVIGMYDNITNTFFTNLGTGTFIAGPEIGEATVTNPVPLITKGAYNSTTKMWETVVSDGVNSVTLEHEQPLSSLGDNCVDRYDNGSLYYNTKYIGLTSGMNWKVEAAYTTDNILVVSAFLAEAIAEADYIYCTHFTPSSDLSQPNHIMLKNRTLYLSIDKQDIASYDDFLRWVDNNNVVVIYQRKATRKISVLPSILLYSHDGTTVFSNDQNADMEIEYRIAPNAKMWQRQADGSFVEITE